MLLKESKMTSHMHKHYPPSQKSATLEVNVNSANGNDYLKAVEHQGF